MSSPGTVDVSLSRRRRWSKTEPPLLSDLRIILLGKSVSENSEVGNFILGRAAFDSPPPDVVERVGGRLKDRHVMVINSPQLLQTNISDHQITQTLRECVYLSDPGPHVIVLVVNPNKFSTEDQERVEKVLDAFAERVFQHTMVLSTQATNETNNILQKIIQKCFNRHFSIQRSSSLDDLLQMFEDIVQKNAGCHLVCAEVSQYFTIKQQARARQSEDELRIVLLGKTGVGKSATGNTILGRVAFKAETSQESVTKESRRESSDTNDRQVTVIDTPGLFDTELSNEEIKREISNCISMILPGPHVFIIVLNLGQRFTQEEATTVNIIQETFGKNSLMFTMLLFTRGDDLKNKTIEECLGKPGSPLMNLVEACGNRYHVFNNNIQTGDQTQVSDLLEKIDAMVASNGGSFYSCKMFREMEREKQEQQLKSLMERVEQLKREREELMKTLEEEKERMQIMIEEERQNHDKTRKKQEEEFRDREERYKKELKEQEMQMKDEMKREREMFRDEIKDRRQEKDNIQTKYDKEIDRMMNRIENERQYHEKERERSENKFNEREEQYKIEIRKEQDQWERQKLEEQMRKNEEYEKEKQVLNEQYQRLQSEMEGILREKERIERERQGQLEIFEKQLNEERHVRENEQKTFDEVLNLIKEQYEEKLQEEVKRMVHKREKEMKIFSEIDALQQVTAYRKLEAEYRKWSWSLYSAMTEAEIKLLNQIDNEGICEVEETDLQIALEETSEELEKSMSEFFEDDSDADILIQWKTSFEIQLKVLQENIVKETKRKLNDILQQRNQKTADHYNNPKNTIYEKTKELALKLKEKAKEEKTMKREFDWFWEKCVMKLIRDNHSTIDIGIMRDVNFILSVKYKSSSAYQWKQSYGYNDIFNMTSYSECVAYRKSPKKVILQAVMGNTQTQALKQLSAQDETQIRTFLNDVVQQTDRMFQSFNISKTGYNISCIQKLIDYITERINEYQEKRVKYVFKDEFIMDFVYSICKAINKTITDRQSDPVKYVEMKRSEYYVVFQKYCHKAVSAAVFGQNICQKLEQSIEWSLYKKTASDLAHEMSTNCPSLNENTSNLEKHILMTLAENKNFSAYTNDINAPNDSEIRAEVSRYIIDNFSVSVLPKLKEKIKLLQQNIMENANESTRHFNKKYVDAGLWLKHFTQQLSDVLVFSEIDLSGVKHDDVDDFHLLVDLLKHELSAVMSQISSRFSIRTLSVNTDLKLTEESQC